MRASSKKKLPGPGHYDAEPLKFKKSVEKVVIPKAKSQSILLDASKINYPSSVDYKKEESIDRINHHIPAAVIPKAKYTQKSFISPGVGTYKTEASLDKVLPHSGAVVFSKSKDGKKMDSIPGPASYKVEDSKDKFQTHNASAIFSKAKEVLPKRMIPGVGKYEVEQSLDKLLNKNPRIVFSKANKIEKFPKIPGPGDYETLPSIYKFGRGKITIPKATGHNVFSKKTDSSMLAYEYEKSLDKLAKHHPCTVISQSKKKFALNKDPGPGSYLPEKVLDHFKKKAPGVVMPKSRRFDD